MAVTFRSKSFAAATGTSPTVAEPAGAVSGDMLVALAIASSAAAVTLPAGWTKPTGFSGTQGVFSWAMGYVARGGSAPSLTFTLSGGSQPYEIHILALKPGVNTVAFDSTSAAGSTGNSAHQPDPPVTTAVKTTTLAVAGGVQFGGSLAGGWTNSAGYVVRSDNTAGNDGFLEDKSLSASGTENPAAIANGATGLQDWWDGGTLTFTDEAGGLTTAQEIPAFLQAGSGQVIGQRWM